MGTKVVCGVTGQLGGLSPEMEENGGGYWWAKRNESESIGVKIRGKVSCRGNRGLVWASGV